MFVTSYRIKCILDCIVVSFKYFIPNGNYYHRRRKSAAFIILSNFAKSFKLKPKQMYFMMTSGLRWTILIVVSVEVCSYVASSNKNVESGEIVSTSNLVSMGSKLCIDEHGKHLDGEIAYKADCRKFVQCGPGVALVVCCQPGLLFNQATKACDWPRLAKCIEFSAVDPTKLVIPATSIPWN